MLVLNIETEKLISTTYAVLQKRHLLSCEDTTPGLLNKCIINLDFGYLTHNFCPVTTRSSFHSALLCKAKIVMLFNNVITDSTYYLKDYPVL